MSVSFLEAQDYIGLGELKFLLINTLISLIKLQTITKIISYIAQETQKGLCTNLEGWDGEGEGREVQKRGDVCVPMADSC